MSNDLIVSANKAADLINQYGWISSDNQPLVESDKTFKAGGHYGVEIPVINSFKILESTVQALKKYDVPCTRFNETVGAFLLSDSEIKEMLDLCRQNNYGILFSIGPRPEYDIKSSFYRSDFGLEMGRRLNNNDAIRASVEEAFRLVELGCKGLIIYDLGLLHLLKKMQNNDKFPRNILFKASTHCMVTNPGTASIYETNGCTSITTAHDLGLPMLANIRNNVSIPLDVPTDVYKSKGGFIRFYEMSEIVQVASPVMLKMGASVQTHPYDSVKEGMATDRIKRVKTGIDIMNKYLPSKYKLINPADEQVCLPSTASSKTNFKAIACEKQ